MTDCQEERNPSSSGPATRAVMNPASKPRPSVGTTFNTTREFRPPDSLSPVVTSQIGNMCLPFVILGITLAARVWQVTLSHAHVQGLCKPFAMREGCRYRDIPQNTAAPGNTAVLYHSKYRGAAVFQYLVACVSVFDLSITGM